jgi:hypothetical protein
MRLAAAAHRQPQESGSGGIVQGNQGTIEQGQGRRDNEFVPAFVRSDERAAADRLGAGTTWSGSAFDLAQGLEVTVFEARISPEELDELFR